MSDERTTSAYPGARLGLPETGRLSIARFGRRLGGYAIDAALSALISFAFFHYSAVASLVIFALLHVLFIPTIGGSPGHRLVGLRVVKATGGWIGLWRPVVRTVLLLLLFPALIWNVDHRGLHDVFAGTMTIRW